MEKVDSNFNIGDYQEEKVSVSLDDFVNLDEVMLLGGSERQSDKVELLSAQNIIPMEGVYLGLDISKSSTGICIIEKGNKETFNVSLNDYADLLVNQAHKEVLLRRKLKEKLSSRISGKEFDVIIIEDAFVGENPKDARLLFALNTAIDELILDGVCKCKTFLRVENSRWKSWLWKGIDAGGEFKGLNDKIRIQECLYKIGIVEKGEGFQDRLDATGLLIGYFLQCKSGKGTEGKKSVNWGQIGYTYVLDEPFIYDEEGWLVDLQVRRFSQDRVTKKFIKEKLEANPLYLYISKEPIKLGFLGEKLGLDYMDEGGYFAFWIKKKYRKNFK